MNLFKNKWTDEHGACNYREGGGILIQYWAPRIRFNIMKDNEAYNKTGLASAGRVIRNNVISDNFGGEDFAGSGIWVYTNRFDSQIKII